jgi:hypothetical protein
MSASLRFPPPWHVEEQVGRFVVRDRNGQALRYVYFKDERSRASAAKLFTRDEARHIAANLAKLPELLKAEGDARCANGPREKFLVVVQQLTETANRSRGSRTATRACGRWPRRTAAQRRCCMSQKTSFDR